MKNLKYYLAVVLLLIAANCFIIPVSAQLAEPKPLSQQKAEQEAKIKQQKAAAQKRAAQQKAAAEKARIQKAEQEAKLKQEQETAAAQKRAAQQKADAEKAQVQKAEQEAKLKQEQKALIPSAINNYKMVYIPGGTFTMGSPADEPARYDNEIQHSVTLSSYYIGATEVTQELWKAVMNNNPSHFKGDNLPVETVSWDDCKLFISKLNQLTGKTYRLPTEAEWEHACRAGTTTSFSTGTNITTSQANYDGNYPYNGNTTGVFRAETMPIGSFKPNAWGLYDMHGNVWEWCSDWYGDYLSSAQTDPDGPSSGSYRVSRGGSWNSYARNCRSSSRFSFTSDRRYYSIGFRLVSSK